MDVPARTDATTPATEEQLAVLREEVGQTMTAMTRGFQRVYGPATWVGVAALFVCMLNIDSGWAWVVALACIPLPTVAGWLLAWPVARRISEQRTLSLRARVAGLTAEQKAALLPAEGKTFPPTPWFSARLLRDLGIPTEVAPASAPEGGGAEVSGTERQALPGD